MRLARTISFILIAIILLFFIIALFLPSTVHVDESISIKSQISNGVYQINNLKNWQKWSPYQQADPRMKVTYEGPNEGIGAKQIWESNEIGNGSIVIREVIPDKSISGDLTFDNTKSALAFWEFEYVNDGTMKLTWNIDVVGLSYPFGKWAGLFMSDKIHNNIQRGLNNIKNLLESTPTIAVNTTTYGKNSEISESVIPAMVVLSIKDSCKMENFSAKFKELYAEINNYMKASNTKQIAPPFAIYHTWNPKGVTVIEACIRINRYIKSNGRIIFTEFPQTKIASIIHYGPYNTVGSAYDALEKYTKSNNKIVIDVPREVYLTDPLRIPDSTNWQTQVYYPIR